MRPDLSYEPATAGNDLVNQLQPAGRQNRSAVVVSPEGNIRNKRVYGEGGAARPKLTIMPNQSVVRNGGHVAAPFRFLTWQ
jgi:hypothetical protein